MKEKVLEYKNTETKDLKEIEKPVALILEINNKVQKDCRKISFLLNKAEVPYFQEKGLIYLPEEFIKTERINDIDLTEKLNLPIDVLNDDVVKIKIRRREVVEEKIEDMVTLAYIAYINGKILFDFDHNGIYVLSDNFIKQRIILARKPFVFRAHFGYYNQDMKRKPLI